MANTELEKVLPPKTGEHTPAADPNAKSPDAATTIEKTPEEIKKEEHRANLDKAIEEATGTLQKIRSDIAAAKNGKDPEEGQDDHAVIDDTDPGAKAWDKRIKDNVAPVAAEMEKEKAEVRTFALRKFLTDKPALARSPEKVKEMIGYYEKIRTSTERTQEGVLLDLQKAYAVVFSDEILAAARSGNIERARTEGIASDVAVDHGATSYQNQLPKTKKVLSAEDRQILAKWGQTEEEWQKDNEKYGSS